MSEPHPEDLQFEGIPARPDPDTWVEEVDGEPVADPTAGRDPDTEWMLRNS